jgi:hypothetical protein
MVITYSENMGENKPMMSALGAYKMNCSLSGNCQYKGAGGCFDGDTVLADLLNKHGPNGMYTCPAGFNSFKEVGTRGKPAVVSDRSFEMKKL